MTAAPPRGKIRSMELVVNGAVQRLDPPPATVAELVRALNLEGKRIAVERNGEIVPKSRYAATAVARRRPPRGRCGGRRRRDGTGSA